MKLMVVSTDKLTDLIVKELREMNPKSLEVVFHMGQVDSDLRASTIRRMIVERKSKRFMFDRTYLNNFSLRFSEDKNFSEGLYKFVDHLYRSNKDMAIKSNKIEYIHEAHDYFYLAFDFISGIMMEYQVDHVLFFNAPHLGYDTLTYEAARFLGIKTTILNQSIFPGKLFSTNSIENFGFYKKNDGRAINYKINKEYLPDLFYMKGIDLSSVSAKNISLTGFLSIFLYIILREPFLLIRWDRLVKLLIRANSVYLRTPKWRDPFAKFFNMRSLEYFEFIAGVQPLKIDLNCKYIYFPLHLQPEMTTSALGGPFVDQALAIEILSSILPDGVKIYVKENPKQTGYMRGPTFYYRINKLKNVQLVPETIKSHDLIRGSVFVATITGTAGWEALCAGKPALVFGNAWYRSLPGAIKYFNGISYDDIASIEIIHDELEKAVGDLQSRMHSGVIDRHYKILVPDYDNFKNTKKVAECVIDLLFNSKNYTFC